MQVSNQTWIFDKYDPDSYAPFLNTSLRCAWTYVIKPPVYVFALNAAKVALDLMRERIQLNYTSLTLGLAYELDFFIHAAGILDGYQRITIWLRPLMFFWRIGCIRASNPEVRYK